MVCFVFSIPGSHWHIEVFISRKQVVERDELCAHTPTHESPSNACLWVRALHFTNLYAYHGVCTCVCLHVRELSLLYFSVCDIWRFAPKANKSVMPGIRPWPLLKLHRQAERLINQTASHRCDGFHTNRQQTVKVTSNRVDCQPGRHAGLLPLSPLLALFPLCCIYPSVRAYPFSPPVWLFSVIHMKYLSCPSKNELEGQGRSIFSDRGHGQTILGTHHISHSNTALRSLSTAVLCWGLWLKHVLTSNILYNFNSNC